MRNRQRIVLGFILIVLTYACGSNGSSDDGADAIDIDTSLEASPSPTDTATPMVTPTPVPTATIEPSPTADSANPEEISVNCSASDVQRLLDTLIERYEARDAQGIVDLMQYEVPGEPFSPGFPLRAHDSEGNVPFRGFAITVQDTRFRAGTHDELQKTLVELFEQDWQLSSFEVEGFDPAQLLELDFSGGPAVPRSERYAAFSVIVSQTANGDSPDPLLGKGAVDCNEGKLVYLSIGAD